MALNCPQNDQKWSKNVQNGQKCLKNPKTTKIDFFYVTNVPFWSLKGGWVIFFLSRGQNRPKIQFCHSEMFFMNKGNQTFTTLYLTQKTDFGAFWGNLKKMFLRKKQNLYTPCSVQNYHLAKNLEKKVFSAHSIQNVTIWNRNVAPKKITKITDTPQASRGPKMAKKHPLKSNDDS